MYLQSRHFCNYSPPKVGQKTAHMVFFCASNSNVTIIVHLIVLNLAGIMPDSQKKNLEEGEGWGPPREAVKYASKTLWMSLDG